MKLLSICVPCYNAAGYMERCLASLPKGEEDVEILIVNDGSTDGTAGIAERYAAKYPRTVRVIHQENKGHGGAVNTGIREAKGLYFKVVDADDRVRKEPFRRIHAALQTLVAAESSPDMLVSNYVYDKEGEKRHRVMRYANALPQERLFTWEEVMHFRKGQYLLMHSVIFRTALLRVCEAIESGARPALVIGVPVGFVNVIEAKEALMRLPVPYIVARGRKGGSNVAAAIVHAALYQLREREV